MAYQVKVYSEAEKGAYRRRVEEKGVAVAELAKWDGTKLQVGVRRPQSNLVSSKEWMDALVQAVQGCQRADGKGRGLSKAEFEELVDVEWLDRQMEELYQGCLKAAQLERSPLYGSTDAQIRSYARKAMNQRNLSQGYRGVGGIYWQSPGGFEESLTPAQAKTLKKRLGW